VAVCLWEDDLQGSAAESQLVKQEKEAQAEHSDVQYWPQQGKTISKILTAQGVLCPSQT
jgi:hypothetical protein